MNPTKILLWTVMGASVLFIIPQVFILLLFGLAPTIVAYVVDKSEKKYAFFSVGGMNIAGVIPSLFELWSGKNSISAAMDILTEPLNLLIMFSGAAFGWIIYLFVPPVETTLLTVVGHHKISVLRSEQKKMIKEWGEGVAIGPKAIDARETAEFEQKIVQEATLNQEQAINELAPEEVENGNTDINS